MTGMSRDQTTVGESTVFNPENIIKKGARGLWDATLDEVQDVIEKFIVMQKG